MQAQFWNVAFEERKRATVVGSQQRMKSRQQSALAFSRLQKSCATHERKHIEKRHHRSTGRETDACGDVVFSRLGKDASGGPVLWVA